MQASRQASVACVALAALVAVGCWDATKVVGLGEVCATRGFDGDVVCEQGLACLVRDAEHEWLGFEKGTCWRACGDDGDCTGGETCVAGYCAPPCGDAGLASCEASSACCATAAGAGCFPPEACRWLQ